MQLKENKLLYQDSEAEYQTRWLLEERETHVLPEARSELEMQELRVEDAYRALHESGLQLHSRRMETFPGESIV